MAEVLAPETFAYRGFYATPTLESPAHRRFPPLAFPLRLRRASRTERNRATRRCRISEPNNRRYHPNRYGGRNASFGPQPNAPNPVAARRRG